MMEMAAEDSNASRDKHEHLTSLPSYVSAWYFSKKELEMNSPSRVDGIDWEMENGLRTQYCTFIKDLGVKLQVPQLTIATAIMFCHRFYMRQSHARNDWQDVVKIDCFLIALAKKLVNLRIEEVAVVIDELEGDFRLHVK